MSEPVQVQRRRSRSNRPTDLNDPTIRRFSDLTIALGPAFLSLSESMRLLAELVIIAVLIFLGWNKPFQQYAEQAHTKITSALDSLGSNLQKHEDKSVKRY
jgi:hypothetical protein